MLYVCMHARVRVCVECVNGCEYVCVLGAHHELVGLCMFTGTPIGLSGLDAAHLL